MRFTDFTHHDLLLLLQGLGVSVALFAATTLIGLAIGLSWAVLRYYRTPLLATVSALLAELLKNSPVLVQLFLVFFGLSRWQTLRRVVAPQAAAFGFGPLTGLLVNQLQVTSLISVIGVVDLTKVGAILNVRTLKPFIVWTVIGLLYYLLARLIAASCARWEARLRAHSQWKGL